MRKYFLIVEGALPGKRAFAVRNGLKIGRGADNDINLSGYDVSRQHAEIHIKGGTPELQDLGSANGSFVNGERVERIAPMNGDRVRIGSFHIEVFEGASPVESGQPDQTVIKVTASELSFVSLLEERPDRLSEPKIQLIRALQRQFDKGCEIQRDFLPKALPRLDHWEIATCFQPALKVGGDFYDFFLLPCGLLAVTIADVCDKGVGAAQFVSVIRTLLRLFAGEVQLDGLFVRENGLTPQQPTANLPIGSQVRLRALQAVSLANSYILREHGELCMYATLFFGVLDPKDGRLSYINAGHEPLYVLGPEGVRTVLKPTALPLGMQPEEAGLDVQDIQIETNQIMLGYTDGLIDAEAESGELFSRKRLAALLQMPHTSAARLIEDLKSELKRHLSDAQPPDDITIIALQRLAP